MPRLIIEIEATPRWPAGSVSVELNGRSLGTVGLNARYEYVIEAGSHTLQVRKGQSLSQLVSFRVAEHEVLNFRCTVHGLLRTSVHLLPLFRRDKSRRFDHHGSPHHGRRSHDLLPWHVVLSVSQQAPMLEIKNAYLALIKNFHPERIRKLPEAQRKHAEDQAKILHAAYAEAKSIRGEADGETGATTDFTLK